MNTLGFLVKPHRVGWWLIAAVMVAYLFFCAIIFFQWVNPSLDGRTDQHIAADSTTYMYMADALREGRNDPWVLAALASFPNTLWMPVFIAFALKSTVLIAVVDLALFWMSIELFRRSSEINVGLFLFFLLLNPTTTISLLSVNKEIVDLLIMALFCYFWTTRHKWALSFALLLSLINRFEVCIVLLMFVAIRSGLNPFRNRRVLTLLIVVLFVNFSLPLFVSNNLSSRFAEASGGQTIVLLDTLEMRYMFALAVLPKTLETMFAELVNVSKWMNVYDLTDLANSYIVYFNNLANLIVVLILIWKRSLRISEDWIYLALLGSVFMSVSMVIQPRYFYFCFALLCLQAAKPRVYQPKAVQHEQPLRSLLGGERVADL
jgi:hypothetical protein